MSSRSIDFWYDFASPYSYMSVMRIEAEAENHNIMVNWKPFLLGPIFRQHGFQNSPFNSFPRKRDYMWRDMERCCAALGLAFTRPEIFPGNGLYAARLALIGAEHGWVANFTKAVFEAYFGHGADLSDVDMLKSVLSTVTTDDVEMLWDGAMSSGNKERLRQQTEHADALGIFGAPTFIPSTQGIRDEEAPLEMFWGNDRLEAALAFEAPHP